MGDWDYIVVGAGSAGCVVANRLSANPANKVLLLEAGGLDWSPFIHVPAAIIKAIGNPRLDWCYQAEPDASRNGKVDLWPAGKVLGGSSAINGMLYVRGRASDYDRWGQLGCSGWSGADVLPVFKRIESSVVGDPKVRGRDGPLATRRLRSTHPLAHVFIEAAKQSDIPFNEDYNGQDQHGISYSEVTQKRGWRFSAARAYLWPVMRRPNLKIATRATVERLLVEGRRCVGVQVRRSNGSVEEERTGGEVVLCAGAIATPKLLMLSGIGPGEALRRHGIDVRTDLPGVGENLREHPTVMVGIDVNVSTYNVEINSWRIGYHAINWLLFGRGPATSPYPHAVGFLKTDPTLTEPDIEVQLGPYAFDFNEAGVVPYPRPAISAAVSPCEPAGIGHIRLRSADPAATPIIDHQLLGEEEDRQCLLRGCRQVRDIFANAAFDAYRVAERLPGDEVQDDAAWEAYLRKTAFLGYHPSGTCKMGVDSQAVTTPDLRVKDIDHLRIADASIMPTLTSGNTNAPVIMIGERCADFMLDASA